MVSTRPARAGVTAHRVISQPRLTWDGGLVPLPVANLRKVFAVRANILRVIRKTIVQELLRVSCLQLQARHPIDHIARQVKAIQVV